MDENVKFVLTLLGGALGAALLGLIGGYIARRSEHAKWLREARMESYSTFLQEADKVRIHLSSSGVKDPKMFDRMLDAEASIALVGPDTIIGPLMMVHHTAVRAKDTETVAAFYSARHTLIDAMRPHIGIRKLNRRDSQAVRDFPSIEPDEPDRSNAMNSAI